MPPHRPRGARVHGLRVDDTTLTLSPWRKPRTIAPAESDHVEVDNGTDSTDPRGHLEAGEIVRIGPRDAPDGRAFAAGMRARGP